VIRQLITVGVLLTLCELSACAIITTVQQHRLDGIAKEATRPVRCRGRIKWDPWNYTHTKLKGCRHS
jgi:hypothetical protein